MHDIPHPIAGPDLRTLLWRKGVAGEARDPGRVRLWRESAHHQDDDTGEDKEQEGKVEPVDVHESLDDGGIDRPREVMRRLQEQPCHADEKTGDQTDQS